MNFYKRKMNGFDAEEILSWRYDPPYDYYNNESSKEAVAELLDGCYHSVYEGEGGFLFGYYCQGYAAQVPAGHGSGAYREECVDVGLGMKPSLTGSGRGSTFLSFILDSLTEEYESKPAFRLTVASFNKRAVTLYSGHGFVKKVSFVHNGVEFVTMIKPPS